MTADTKVAAYAAISLIVTALALGGWGAFAYTLFSTRQRDDLLRQEVGRLTVERQKLTDELTRTRSEADRHRQQLEQTRKDLERVQADLVAVRAQAASLSEQLKMRGIPAPSPPGTPAPQRRQGR